MKCIKRGFAAIKKYHFIFCGLIILQLLFLVSFFALVLHYQVKILEDSQEIIQSLEKANYDAKNLQAGQPFLKDLVEVNKNYNSLVENICYFLLLAFLLYIMINGLIWSATHCLIKKTKLFKCWAKIAFSSLVFFIPPFIFIYLILKVFIRKAPELIGSLGWALLILFFIMYYLLLVIFAFIDVDSWKKAARKIFFVGIKRIHYNLLILITMLILIFGIGSLIVLAVNHDYNFVIPVFLILILNIIIVTNRIIWIIYLNHEKDSNRH